MRLYDNQPSGTVARARQLRRNMTEAEKRLRYGLREMFPAARFRRQVPIGPYFADFLGVRNRLIIELDGGQHALQASRAYDETRTRFLQADGYRVVRICNSDVLPDPEGALKTIASHVGAVQ